MQKLAACALLTVLAAVAQPSEQARKLMAEMGHGEGRLQPGDLAPDFDLRKVKSRDRVRLSSFRGKRPVVLLFGSYT